MTSWTRQFEDVSDLSWATLRKVPEWTSFERTMKCIQERGLFKENEDVSVTLLRQFTYLTKFITSDKIEYWNNEKTSCEERWVECFQHFKNNNVPADMISAIIEYIFCLPGTSATVERVFSAINKIWSNEKTRLQIKTLKSILLVKYNMKFSCLDFFTFLKSKPELLKKISTQEKYVQN